MSFFEELLPSHFSSADCIADCIASRINVRQRTVSNIAKYCMFVERITAVVVRQVPNFNEF